MAWPSTDWVLIFGKWNSQMELNFILFFILDGREDQSTYISNY